MRVGVFSGDGRRGADGELLDRVRAAPADGRRGPAPARSTTPRPTSSRRSGERRFTRRRARPRHQGDDARADGASAGIEVHVLPAHHDRSSDVLALGARTGCSSPTARATRRPPTHAVALLARGARAPDPVLRHLLRQPDPRPGARLRHLQAAATATAGINQPVHGPHHRQGRGHRAQPRVRRRRAARRASGRHPVRPRARSATSASTTTCVEGLRCLDVPGVLRAVPPGGGGRPARRRRTCSTGSSTLMARPRPQEGRA